MSTKMCIRDSPETGNPGGAPDRDTAWQDEALLELEKNRF